MLAEGAFLFALIWSVGATGDGESRKKFDALLRNLLSGSVPEGYFVSARRGVG
jgi:dynein heavy chain